MAHTKGPWQISGNIDSEAGVVSEDGKWIVEPQSMWTEEDKANLRLIAAAPELYEALKRLISEFGIFCCENCINEDEMEKDHPDFVAAVDFADAALAKAGDA